MKSFPECMEVYKKQMKKGEITIAYGGLMSFLLNLRNQLQTNHPEFYVSGNFYQGYLDFSYFSFTPLSLKKRKLRIAIVFLHKSCEFKIWLGGLNKKVQADYWGKLSKKGFEKYSLPESIANVDFIIEDTLAADPDWNNLNKLTSSLEKAIVNFANDVERYIAKL